MSGHALHVGPPSRQRRLQQVPSRLLGPLQQQHGRKVTDATTRIQRRRPIAVIRRHPSAGTASPADALLTAAVSKLSLLVQGGALRAPRGAVSMQPQALARSVRPGGRLRAARGCGTEPQSTTTGATPNLGTHLGSLDCRTITRPCRAEGHALAARQVSGMAGPAGESGAEVGGQGAASHRPPQGATTRRPDGRASRGNGADGSRAAAGPSRGRALPGRRDAARAPAWRSARRVSDQLRDDRAAREHHSTHDHGRCQPV